MPGEHPLTVICWKWAAPGYRSQYGPEHVHVLRNMVARNLHIPHEFACITDDPAGLDPDIRVIPLWDDLRHLGRCYLRLKAFAPEARELIGPRFLSLDLDCVILDDITPLATRREDFVIAAFGRRPFSRKARRKPYNGSMWLLTAGARPQLWHDFDPERSWREAHAKGFIGSDQAWIAYKQGRREAVWTERDGIYRFRPALAGSTPPKGARIVFFAGKTDPWQPETQAASPWIAEHYR